MCTQTRYIELSEQARRPMRLPETRQRVELGQRTDQLGFRRGTRIVSMRGVARDSGNVLQPKPLRSLSRGRMSLKAQGFVHRQHLEQKREPATPPVRTSRP